MHLPPAGGTTAGTTFPIGATAKMGGESFAKNATLGMERKSAAGL
jgi:hypothetical protein